METPSNDRQTGPPGGTLDETPLHLGLISSLTICHTLDNSAQALGLSDSAHWTNWVCYLLEALEYKVASRAEYKAFLERLQREINARLERGRW